MIIITLPARYASEHFIILTYGSFMYLHSICDVSVVILVPTRELALQTSQVCKELGKHLKIQIMVTTGGTSLKDDIMRLYQPVHLLVGTPGRILDLARKGVCILKDCSMLIMDEVFHCQSLYVIACCTLDITKEMML